MASTEDAVVQVEDALYYFSDVMSSGTPYLGNFITENILQLLVFRIRIVLPSLQRQRNDLWISVSTSMYLIGCILHIFKDKDMAITVATALFHQHDCTDDRKQETPNGCISEHDLVISERQVNNTSVHDLSNGDTSTSLSSAHFQCLPNHPLASEFSQGSILREHFYHTSQMGMLSKLWVLCAYLLHYCQKKGWP